MLVASFLGSVDAFHSSKNAQSQIIMHDADSIRKFPLRSYHSDALFGRRDKHALAFAHSHKDIAAVVKNVTGALYKGSLSKMRTSVMAGVMSGFLQAGIFHPWDRALYLSQTNNRSARPACLVRSPTLAGSGARASIFAAPT